MTRERIYKGVAGIGLPVEGEALVADDNFSARYDLDRITGVFHEFDPGGPGCNRCGIGSVHLCRR